VIHFHQEGIMWRAVVAAALGVTVMGAVAAHTVFAQHQPTASGQVHDHGTMPSHAAEAHAQHMQAMRAMAGGMPTMSGQDAFGAIAEIVRVLEADPGSDWSKVDVERLRQHLIDMSEVVLRAAVKQTPLIAMALGAIVQSTGLGAAEAQHGVPTVPGGPSAHRLAEMCATAFEKNIATGRGFGMAFAADHNGYPGPLHILELKDQLKSTPEQEAKAQALMAATLAESRPRSARLLDAEAKLRQLFASGQADETTVRAVVAEVEKARTGVRLVHLMTHLKTRDLLTEEQRRLYHEARWSLHGPIGPHGGGSPAGGAPMK
jgi:Spy/CpxP family protein refolding chaperone